MSIFRVSFRFRSVFKVSLTRNRSGTEAEIIYERNGAS